jgi:hypothetical protein
MEVYKKPNKTNIKKSHTKTYYYHKQPESLAHYKQWNEVRLTVAFSTESILPQKKMK